MRSLFVFIWVQLFTLQVRAVQPHNNTQNTGSTVSGKFVIGDCRCNCCPKKDSCANPIDVVFLIDGSDSITATDFNVTKIWILKTLDALKPPSGKHSVQLWVVQYSHLSKIEVKGTSITTGSGQVQNAVQKIKQMRSSSMMYSALQNVNNNVYPKMRRGAYKVLITMTDGRSSDRNPIAVQNARKLYDHSIAIGVGTDINWAELQNLASTNNDFIFVPNFSRLNDSIAKIVEDICNKTTCAHDIIIAIDSSACVEKSFPKMHRFIQNFVNRIQNENHLGFGVSRTRLAVMQFLNKAHFHLNLSSFDNYTKFPNNQDLTNEVNKFFNRSLFTGKNSFLDKALVEISDHFEKNPRPYETSPQNKKIVLLLTNGNYHPKVKTPNISNSIASLKHDRIRVLTIATEEACKPKMKKNENCCPNVTLLKELAEFSDFDSLSLLSTRSGDDVLATIMSQLKCSESDCRKCDCSCKIPIPDPEKCIKCERGPPGLCGKPGPAGLPGETGERGAEGPVGPNGIQGIKGKEGPQGPKGSKGYPGAKGNVGQSGRAGPRGATGYKGDKGEVGAKGYPGSKGERGLSGIDGIDGSQGPRGRQGLTGPPGPPCNISETDWNVIKPKIIILIRELMPTDCRNDSIPNTIEREDF